MIKLARLKTIFRNNIPIEVVSDKLDNNSVDSINIVDQSVTSPKIQNNSLNFGKMTDDTKYINTNHAICALRNVGGISIGDEVDSVSIRDLLKEIITPYTPPAIGTVKFDYLVTGSLSEGITSGIQVSTLNLVTGSSVTIRNIRVPVMIKSEEVESVTVKIYVRDTLYAELTKPKADLGTFLPNTYNNINFEFNDLIAITGINITENIRIESIAHDATANDDTVYRSYIYFMPYVYFGNSNISVTHDINNTITTSNIFTLLEYDSSYLFSYYNSALNMPTHIYEKPTNEYSYIILPTTSRMIYEAKDQNGFTQNIEFLGNLTINLNSVPVNYRLFKTGISTMENTNPSYIFKVE